MQTNKQTNKIIDTTLPHFEFFGHLTPSPPPHFFHPLHRGRLGRYEYFLEP